MKQGARRGAMVLLGAAIALLLALGWGDRTLARDPNPPPPTHWLAQAEADPAAPPEADGPPEPVALKPFEEVVKGLTVSEGLVTVYHDLSRNRALLGLKPSQINQNLLLLATLESGLGEAGLFRGWPVGDLTMQFRQISDNRLQVVVPNVYFRTPRPQGQALLRDSFSDSVLTTLPIQAIHSTSGEILVDLKDWLLSRDPVNVGGQVSQVLSGYSVSGEASYLGPVKTFPENVELETVLAFSGSAPTSPFAPGIVSLPDGRGFNLRVRYSLSAIPHHPTFEPRLADERVGYFITAYRAAAQPSSGDPFVRYIQRWHLEKQDPSAALSPPRQPLVFWLENTIPPEYREAIADGVRWWNAAFEQAGFLNAIEVRQMPANADWDPADVRYNVIRWSDSFYPETTGYGPSRVNPLTGEILDADVVLDAAGIVGDLSYQYDALVAGSAARSPLCGTPVGDRLLAQLAQASSPGPGRLAPARPPAPRSASARSLDLAEVCAGVRAAQTTAMGSLAIATLAPPFTTREARTVYIEQFLRMLTAHEVGHVLGLRHNFLGSTLLETDALNDPAAVGQQGMASSVMDYLPPNLAAPGQPQGDYFPTQLGPYDRWAIEYGYRPVANRVTAQRELQPIANRSGSPELAYAPDEDAWAMLDPKAIPWDLSRDPLGYAEGQIALSKAIWNRLDWFSVNPGEGYGRLRRRVDLVFAYYGNQAYTIANYIGGQRFLRTDPWGSRGQPPLAPMAAAEQRRALAVLQDQVFAPDALSLSPELLSRLAPDRWWHWGETPRIWDIDYPIYDRILFTQGFTLSALFDGYRLLRVRDNELKQADAFTLAELFDRTQQAIWAEVLSPPAEATPIPSLRQGLQRHHLNTLISLVLRNHGSGDGVTDLMSFLAQEFTAGAPDEARVLARYQLRQIQGAIARQLNRQGRQLDLATLAYLEDVGDRITKVLDAPLQGR